MSTPTDAIVAHDLVFRYPPGRGEAADAAFTLRLPAWTVPAGGRVVVHGPSGCGKSTLLSLVAGVLAPTAGSLRVAGVELADLPEPERRRHRITRLGFVFQDYPLVHYLDALDNVLLPFRLHPALTLDTAARQRAAELLTALDLGGKQHRRPHHLSQGERQRVAIARALVTEPAVLLADEPTTGLDARRTDDLLALLDGLVADRGLTLVLVTHDTTLRARFADQLDATTLDASAPTGSPP